MGLGSIGRRHLRLVKELRPELNITAVRSGKGQEVEEENLLNESVCSLEEAINYGIEAAIIATPAVYHIRQGIELMKRGIHLLIEKPLSHSLENINELLTVSKESKSVGLLGYCLRYNPGALKFKEKLNSKEIGQILHVRVDCGSYLPDWRKGQDYRQSVTAKSELGGGALLELSHELDYIRWFFGDMRSVFADIKKSGTLDIDVEDSAEIIFDTDQGYSISVHLDFNTHSNRRKCTARCSNGDLTWDAIDNKLIWKPADGVEEVEAYQIDSNYVYKEQLKHFFSCIESGKKPPVSIHDGVAVLKIIDSIKESHKIGAKVFLA